MPKPKPDESESDFVARCIPIVIEDGAAEDGTQGAAICHSIFEDARKTMNDKLLAAIKARGEKQEQWNRGILTADRYVKTLQDCVGIADCYKYAATKEKSFDDILRKSAKTLTYNIPEMVVQEKAFDGRCKLNDVNIAGAGNLSKLPDGIELPKNTLMVFHLQILLHAYHRSCFRIY